MLAVVQTIGNGQQELRKVHSNTSIAFVAASTLRDPTKAAVVEKAALLEKANAIMKEPDPAKQKSAWNALMNEWKSRQPALEGACL